MFVDRPQLEVGSNNSRTTDIWTSSKLLPGPDRLYRNVRAQKHTQTIHDDVAQNKILIHRAMVTPSNNTNSNFGNDWNAIEGESNQWERASSARDLSHRERAVWHWQDKNTPDARDMWKRWRAQNARVQGSSRQWWQSVRKRTRGRASPRRNTKDWENASRRTMAGRTV